MYMHAWGLSFEFGPNDTQMGFTSAAHTLGWEGSVVWPRFNFYHLMLINQTAKPRAPCQLIFRSETDPRQLLFECWWCEIKRCTASSNL